MMEGDILAPPHLPECKSLTEMVADFRRDISSRRLTSERSPSVHVSPLHRSIEDSLEHGWVKRNYSQLDEPSPKSCDKKALEKETQLIVKTLQLTKAESNVKELQFLAKRMKLEFETKEEKLNSQHKWDEEMIDDLQSRVTEIQRKEECRLEETEDNLRKLISEKEDFKSKTIILQQDKFQMENELNDVRTTSRQTNLELKLQAVQLEAELESCRNQLFENGDVKSLLNQYLKKKQENDMKMEESENEIQQLKLKVLELQNKECKDESSSVTLQFLTQGLAKSSELEEENKIIAKENKELKSLVYDGLVLEQQVAELQEKLSKSEKQCENFHQQGGLLEYVQKELKNWEKVVSTCCSGEKPTPDSIVASFTKLQENNISLFSQLGNLRNNLDECQHNKQKLENEAKEFTSQVNQLQALQDESNIAIKKLNRKLQLITMERNSLKTVLSSYENDMSTSEVQSERVASLEELLESYRCFVENFKVSGEEDKKEKDTCAELEKQIKELIEAKENLEAQLKVNTAHGVYDPNKQKLIHMQVNPASEAQRILSDEFETLRLERDSLLERVKLLEEGRTSDITMQVHHNLQVGSSSKDYQELKGQLDRSVAKNKRQWKAFKKSSRDFRDGVYMLTGYKIDSVSENNFKLMSMYAEAEEDYLQFELSGEGMQLLESPFIYGLSDLIDLHLRRHNSIPGFLSSITLDLFSKQTVLEATSNREEAIQEDSDDDVITLEDC